MTDLKRLYQGVVPEQFRLWLWSRRHEGVPAFLLQFGPWRGLLVYAKLRRMWGAGTIAIRIPQSSSPVHLRRGTTDAETFAKIFVSEEYAPPPGVRPKVIIDGGANAGFASLYFAARFPNAQVFAVEPEASNVEILRLNVGANRNIHVVPSALWGEPAEVRIANPDSAKWTFRVEPSSRGAGIIKAVTVPELMARARCSEIDILKLDIEGAEKSVFAGSPAWISSVRCIMIELHDRIVEDCEATLRHALFGHPFREYQQGENLIFVKD